MLVEWPHTDIENTTQAVVQVDQAFQLAVYGGEFWSRCPFSNSTKLLEFHTDIMTSGWDPVQIACILKVA